MSLAIRAITRLQDADDVDFSTPPSSGQALVYDGVLAKWQPGSAGVTDHGALTGLGDDDHTQYALADGSRGSFLRLTGGSISGNLTVSSYIAAGQLGLAGGGAAPRFYTPGFGILSVENGSGYGGRFYNFYTYDGSHPEIRGGGYTGATLVLSGDSTGAMARTNGASGIALVVRGAPSQTANLLKVDNSTAAEQFGIGPTGQIRTNQTAANTNTPSGATARQLPLYDAAGSLLGYVPVYASPW